MRNPPHNVTQYKKMEKMVAKAPVCVPAQASVQTTTQAPNQAPAGDDESASEDENGCGLRCFESDDINEACS